MRRRLNFVALAVTSMVALAFLVPLANLVHQLAEDRALTQAERDAQLIAQAMAATSGVLSPEAAFAALTINGTFFGRDISLILPDGEVFGAPLDAEEDISAAFEGSTLRIATSSGEAVLVPLVGADDDLAVIQIQVTAAELHRGVTRSWLLLGLVSLTLVTIGVAVTDRLARSIVAPVEELGDAARRLGSGDFSVRVDPAGPEEVSATGRQFNRLAGDLGRLIQAERETAADLSHRLRTPLMAARLAVEQIDDPRRRRELTGDLDSMERGIDHAIEELRRPSRLLAGDKAILEEVVQDRADFWAALAEDQGRATSIVIPDSATPVSVPAADLVAAIDALLGNVFAHTPEGTAYEVRVAIGPAAMVTISDSGPGVDFELAALRGRSSAGSTGLGLDIARKTVESADGTMTIGKSSTGGAEISLRFPH